MTPGDLFLRPGLLVGLALVPLAWLAMRAVDRARARRRAAAIGPRETARLSPALDRRRAMRRGLVTGALACLVVAAARPALGAHDGRERVVASVVVCLDVSRSMLAQDVAPSRLALAKAQIRGLARRAAGDRLALVVFAGEARLAVPLTEDVATVAAVADVADPGSVTRGGTDLGAAIDAAVDALARGGAQGGAVFLASDGEDLEGKGLAAATRARSRGVGVHAVGFGTALGGKIALDAAGGSEFVRDREGRDVITSFDPKSLARLAEAGGGRFLDSAVERDGLATLFDRDVMPTAQAAAPGDETRGRRDRSAWALLAALLSMLGGLALSDRRGA